MSVPAIAGVATGVTAFVGVAAEGPFETAVPVASAALFAATFGSAVTPLSLAVSQFFENGGTHAIVVAVSMSACADDSLSAPDVSGGGRGLRALEAAARFDLLCVPAFGFDEDAGISARTRRAAVALCQRRRALYVADPLPAWTSAGTVLSGPDSIESNAWGLPRDSHAAVYLPRLIVADPAGGSPITCGPCGAVAGVIARVDRERGVWRAPAGLYAGLRGVSTLAAGPGGADEERLNAAGINLLRVFPERGAVVWGARTLEGDDPSGSEWKYVPVRRLSLFIEQSIEEGTQWAASEPNGQAMWSELRRVVSTFLQTLFAAGAFQGRTPREAYFVKCDAQTTTADDIAAGRTHVIVGFAPLKPAEFVVLEVMVKTAGPDDE
jgi:phage tail sheath protein FI